ncbi:hypothetical protein [Paracoccus simplex]|uniref:Uncharacterized protein n=1 Tax=Paracoccus simplex TaxID=2086346 RepID=A0ABV7RYN8_9RHOB
MGATSHHPRPDITDAIIDQWAKERADDAGALARRIVAGRASPQPGADDAAFEALARAYDREDAAQRGEPDPWSIGTEDEPGWVADRIACARAGLAALTPAPDAPQPEGQVDVRLATREELLADEILAELTRARTKFPGKNVTFAALVEEVGELATATFEESADRVHKEAVQVAVMAMRMILDGDHCFEAWRAEKGLDPLDPALRAQSEGRTDG